jgi:hypothetical protein
MAARFWKNWAGNQSCECDLPAPPRSLDDLTEIVRNAAQAGKRVRAVGGGYSWSPLVTNDGEVIVRMHKLSRLIHYDEDLRTVEVECGMSIEELTKQMADEGMTLLTPTLFPRPTVGGVVATGSHGMGFAFGNFSDQILEMTIVRADGSVRTIDATDPDFAAAQVALGSLGIVYSVKISVVPEFNVYIDKRYVPVSYVLEEFEDLQASYEFLEIFWFPLQDKMWLYLMNTTRSKADSRSWWGQLKRRVNTWFQELAAGAVIPWLAKHVHQATPILNRIASRLANKVEASVEVASDAFHHQRAYALAWDVSYSLHAHDAAAAWRKGIDLVAEYARADRYPVNLAMHCRFTGKSNAWLAANYDRETLFIEVATAKGTPNWQGFFEEMEQRWTAFDGARPHWGKLFWKVGAVANQYGRMNDFLEVRQRWDPNRTFLNEFLEKEVFRLPPLTHASRQQPARAATSPVPPP